MALNDPNLVSAGFAFVAAVLWLISASVRVKAKPKIDKDGWTESSHESDDNNVVESAKLQQRWSRMAALAAAAAAAAQGIALVASSGAA